MAGKGGGADGEWGGDGEVGERGGVERGEGLQGHAGGRRLGSHGREEASGGRDGREEAGGSGDEGRQAAAMESWKQREDKVACTWE